MKKGAFSPPPHREPPHGVSKGIFARGEPSYGLHRRLPRHERRLPHGKRSFGFAQDEGSVAPPGRFPPSRLRAEPRNLSFESTNDVRPLNVYEGCRGKRFPHYGRNDEIILTHSRDARLPDDKRSPTRPSLFAKGEGERQSTRLDAERVLDLVEEARAAVGCGMTSLPSAPTSCSTSAALLSASQLFRNHDVNGDHLIAPVAAAQDRARPCRATGIAVPIAFRPGSLNSTGHRACRSRFRHRASPARRSLRC